MTSVLFFHVWIAYSEELGSEVAGIIFDLFCL